MGAEQEKDRHFFSKIKHILIELHDYRFFHGPSEIDKPDSRFIGRKGIINKLKAILTADERKSGSYLITGYRGMGKSSFVSKAISEISSCKSEPRITARLVRLLLSGIFLIILYSLLNRYIFDSLSAIRIGVGFIVLASFSYLIFLSTESVAERQRRKDTLKDTLKEILSPGADYFPAHQHIILLKDVFIIHFLLSIIFSIRVAHISDFIIKPKLLALYVILLIIWFVLTAAIFFVLKHGKETFPKIKERIATYINYSHRYYITLNLGYEKLQEIDILRLMVQNTYIAYMKALHFSFPPPFSYLGWKVIKFTLLFVFIVGTYFAPPINNAIWRLKAEVSLSALFPSQVENYEASNLQFVPQDSPFVNLVFKWTNFADYALYTGYYYATDFIAEATFSREPEKLGNRIRALNLYDYWLWLYVLLIWYGANLIGNVEWFGVPNHTSARRKLEHLIDSLHAQITLEKGGAVQTSKFGFDLGFGRKKAATYPTADIREIEQRFIEILDKISKIPKINIKPEFTFIFDELDKIEPDESDGADKQNRYFDYGWHYSSEGVRRRQQKVLKILSNLKRLFTTAKAKFIFIAGREMYDAIMADVSDRNFFVSSIFHEVIYVNSFLTDPSDGKLADITSMVEAYVCRYLLPPQFHHKEGYGLTLNGYNRYLRDYYFEEGLKGVYKRGAYKKKKDKTEENKQVECKKEEGKTEENKQAECKNEEGKTEENKQVECKKEEGKMEENKQVECKKEEGKMEENKQVEYKKNEDKTEENKQVECKKEENKQVEYKKEEDKKEMEKYLLRLQRHKIITTLQNFIIYLTYRSNGAPKKITAIMEDFITRPEHFLNQNGKNKDDDNLEMNFLRVGSNPHKLYLSFGFYEQYTFGMVAYLVNPVILSINRAMKDFGDKLLISTTFLLDHLYKFHNFAFSRRNLEAIPEFLDINKPPELQELIRSIVDLLSKTHLKNIPGGLFSLKFRRRIMDEISFLSKISERESAAFNFTHDASLSIKSYFEKKLEVLKADYHQSATGRDQQDYIHSIGFIHTMLGDLHFFDEEYNEAIIQYMEAIQFLRPHGNRRDVEIYRFVLLVRNMLKFSFTFEKKKIFDSAFINLGKLISLIAANRGVDLRNLGLMQARMNQNENLDRWDNTPHYVLDDIISENQLIDITLVDKRGPVDEGQSQEHDKAAPLQHDQLVEEEIFPPMHSGKRLGNKDDFAKLITELPYTSRKEDLFLKTTIVESVHFIYQPLLARLQILEKGNLGGITRLDVLRTVKAFTFLSKLAEYSARKVLEAEFYRKIGDILFYKSGILAGSDKTLPLKDFTGSFEGREHTTSIDFNSRPWSIGAAFHYHAKSLVLFYRYYLMDEKTVECFKLTKLDDDKEILSKAVRNKLKKLTEGFKGNKPYTQNEFIELIAQGELQSYHHIIMDYCWLLKEEDVLDDIFKNIHNGTLRRQKASIIRQIASVLSSIGDGHLSLGEMGQEPKKTFFEKMLGRSETRKGGREPEKTTVSDGILFRYSDAIFEDFDNDKIIEKVFLYYCLSALLYKNAGAYRQYAFQLTKILYVIREYCTFETTDKEAVKKYIQEIQDEIMPEIYEGYYRSYEGIHRMESEKFAHILKKAEDITPNYFYDLDHLSLSADFREVVILMEEIKLLCASEINKCKEDSSTYRDYNLVHPYLNVNSIYNRIFELRYKSKLNWRLIIQKLNGFARELAVNIHIKDITKIRYVLLGNEDINYLKNHEQNNKALKPEISKFRQKLKNHLAAQSTFSNELEFLISDAIFCHHEIIRSSKIFGVSYLISHSMLGSAHEKLGHWCEIYDKYRKFCENEDRLKESASRLEKKVKSLIGEADMYTLSPKYHYELAIHHFASAKEAHNEGGAYKKIIENMFYLNDDFNDHLIHFSVALERYRLSSKKIERKLKLIHEHIRMSSLLYAHERYIKGSDESKLEELESKQKKKAVKYE